MWAFQRFVTLLFVTGKVLSTFPGCVGTLSYIRNLPQTPLKSSFTLTTYSVDFNHTIIKYSDHHNSIF